MRYEGQIYRPPSEADALIVQATIGCSWNHCTYCGMYRDKSFRIRPPDEIVGELQALGERLGRRERSMVRKVFVADGDALAMPMDHWLPILRACRTLFPALKRVSSYATAFNLLEKGQADLRTLREEGLTQLYIGPESGDDVTLKRIAKGQDFDAHVEAARKARRADMVLSAIFLLGAGGIDRSEIHARESARLATAMDPAFLAALTLSIVPGTPLATLRDRGRFQLPDVKGLLRELRLFVQEVKPTSALFRSNHASNYLPIGGRLPRDRAAILETIDLALEGRAPLRPEWARGL